MLSDVRTPLLVWRTGVKAERMRLSGSILARDILPGIFPVET